MGEANVTCERLGTQALLRMNRPQELLALNEGLLRSLDDAYARLAADSQLSVIVLAGRSDQFLAGVDLPFFVRALLQGDLARILRFTRDAHAFQAKLEQSAKPVVAWVEGAAIGAGVELALACQRIVAAPTAKFAFPETGLGIYPGMGGTQRTVRRIGVGLAKWLIYTGTTLPAAQAHEIGLIDAISAAEAPDVGRVLAAPRRETPADRPEKYARLEEFFSTHDVATLLDPAFDAPREAALTRSVIQVRGKAPLALALAEKIIDRGAGAPLAEGIEVEFSHLAEIFATADARLGLLTFGKTRPEFTGK